MHIHNGVKRVLLEMANAESGNMLRNKDSKIVLNVFNYMKNKTPKKNRSWITSETAKGTAISRAMVCTILPFHVIWTMHMKKHF